MSKKDIKVIPRGELCYTVDEDGTHYCPYFHQTKDLGVYCEYCEYRVYGDQVGSQYKHLWDMVKVCGQRL